VQRPPVKAVAGLNLSRISPAESTRSVSATQLRKYSFIACLFLVLLRVAIGWQLFYEGMWKYQSQYTGQPWSAAGYLKNAKGPMRDFYRGMVHDPDDLEKLDYDKVAAMWDDWQARFLAKHPDLSDGAKRKLDEFLNGPQSNKWIRGFEAGGREIPAGVDMASVVDESKLVNSKGERDLKHVTFEFDNKRIVSTKRVIPRELEKLKALAKPIDKPVDELTEEEKAHNEAVKIYQATVKELGIICSRLSLKEKLEVSLLWDKDRAGVTITPETHKKLYPMVEGTLDEHRKGDIELYRNYLARYESHLDEVNKEGAPNFAQEHLDKQWTEIQQKRAELVGPVNAWTNELIRYGEDLLNEQQLTRGRVPAEITKTDTTNWQVTWALLILGGLMILGFFSRISALGAAVLLFSFYMAMPPFPGVPPAPGPEHSLIVNKNLIEVIACLSLAALPTGRWFGIDGLFRRVVLRKKD